MSDPLYEEVGASKPQADAIRWMPFKNNSSETVPPGGVMRVTNAQKGTNSRRVLLTCDKPSSTFRRIYAINGHSQVAAGRYGSCTYAFDGPVMVAYEGGTPAIEEGWGAKPGSWKLNKNYPCGFTHQGYNNTSKSTGLFVQQPINSFIGKLNGSLSPNGSVAISLWKGTAGSEADETSWDVTAYDWSGFKGASGDRAQVVLFNGNWYITQLGGSCIIGGNPASQTSYDAAKKQALIQNAGACPSWYEIATC